MLLFLRQKKNKLEFGSLTERLSVFGSLTELLSVFGSLTELLLELKIKKRRKKHEK